MKTATDPAHELIAHTPADCTQIMGYRFLDCDPGVAAQMIADAARNNIQHNVFFVNAHCVNVAARDNDYRNILRSESFLFADGAGLELAALIQGKKLANNLNGTDLFPLICAAAARQELPVALLGAAPGIAQACADSMRARFPALNIVSVHDGYLREAAETQAINEINASGARILFVAKGVPMQEHWIAAHRSELQTPIILGVGALFDFYSGTMPRAPQILRKLRLEWVFRLLQEPRRMFRRYVIGNPEFILRALWMRVTGHAE